MKDSLILSDDDDDGPDSEIERITNVNENEDEMESSRPITPRAGEKIKSPFSQLFGTQTAPVSTTGNAPSTNKSDSDDDDEFIAMLKRK
jgi:hypothetical protein